MCLLTPRWSTTDLVIKARVCFAGAVFACVSLCAYGVLLQIVSIARHALTALPFRSDTATYSNNGASMHCTTTLNDISAIASGLPSLPGGISPLRLVGISLSRWLDGAPSYADDARPRYDEDYGRRVNDYYGVPYL